MRILVFLGAAISMIWSCRKTSELEPPPIQNRSEAVEAPAALTWSKAISNGNFHMFDDDIMPALEIEISLSYPDNNGKFANAIANAFFPKMYKPNMTFHEVADNILRSWTSDYSNAYQAVEYESISGYAWNWEYHDVLEVHSVGENYIVLRRSTNSYTGGAHGMYSSEFLMFDAHSCDLLTFEEMFNVNARAVFIERQKQFLATLEDEEVYDRNYLKCDNFYIENDTVFFNYNPYEIAPFAWGMIRIPVPINSVGFVFK